MGEVSANTSLAIYEDALAASLPIFSRPRGRTMIPPGSCPSPSWESRLI